jgi:methylated-DNA-[protein]-cysteine S-methyltransferase
LEKPRQRPIKKEDAKLNHTYKKMESPVGCLTLIASAKGLSAVLWSNDPNGRVKVSATVEDKTHPILLKAEQQLKEYFSGKRKIFSIEMDAIGTTFQKNVWRALATIPFGRTQSYAQIAQLIKKPKASRAVGAANGKNPLSIIIPCHRVIGSNGKLTGFAGGLKIKEQLLKFESEEGDD